MIQTRDSLPFACLWCRTVPYSHQRVKLGLIDIWMDGKGIDIRVESVDPAHDPGQTREPPFESCGTHSAIFPFHYGNQEKTLDDCTGNYGRQLPVTQQYAALYVVSVTWPSNPSLLSVFTSFVSRTSSGCNN